MEEYNQNYSKKVPMINTLSNMDNNLSNIENNLNLNEYSYEDDQNKISPDIYLFPQRKTLAPELISSNTIKNNNKPLFDKFDSRKTYNQTNLPQKEKLFKKRITEFLLKTNKKKSSRLNNGNDIPKDLIDILYDEELEISDEDDDYDENNIYHGNGNEHPQKFKSLVKDLIKTKRSNEWNEYMESYKKRVKESQTLRYKLKTIFHINSDFIVIWKTTLRIFDIFILFVFFFKYVFLTLADNDSSLVIPKRILIIYNMINAMFIIDLFFSILILIFNGGSKLTYFKLPLKIYTCIPFELKKENFYYLLPKFIRIDIFQKIFSSWENYINLKAEFYIHKYILKLFIKCITQIIKYLLIFGLYAHINCCILSYLDGLNYPSSLFYTIEAFTVIGFGEQSPKNLQSVILVILNLFVGVNLFSLMTSNIKDLSNKIYSFNRDTSLFDNFEMNIFQLQKSIGRILPSKTKQLMISFLLFRRGLSFHDLKEEYENIFKSCKNSLIEEIRQQVFEFLKLEYQHFFLKNVSDDFLYDIFENLKPKIFKKKQVIIKYGEKVNKLYFLLSGQIFATNNKNLPIFTMMDSSIFGEYEFMTNTLSYFNIAVSPKMPAYGFVLDKKSWENISKKHVYSANYFIKKIILKRKKHMHWINKKTTKLFDKLPTIKEEKTFEENSEMNKINNTLKIKDLEEKNIINTIKIEKDKNKTIKSIHLGQTYLEKNPKYNYSNINIIKNIDELHRKINKIEFNFIDSKEFILKNLKNEYL